MIRVNIPARFTIPVTLARQAPGSYVDGLFVNGFEQQTAIRVSWQPLKPSEYRLLPEGESPMGVFNVWWGDGVFVYGKEGGTRSDELIRESIRYKLLFPTDWSNAGYSAALFQESRP